MTAKKEKSPMSKPDFFETGLKESGVFTRKQVIELLKKQVSLCALSIHGDNLSEYNARRKIMETKIVEF